MTDAGIIFQMDQGCLIKTVVIKKIVLESSETLEMVQGNVWRHSPCY